MSDLKGVPKKIIATADRGCYPTTLTAYADLIVRNGIVVKDRQGTAGRDAYPDEIAICKELSPDEARILIDAAAWRGETPAEGTRRRLILDAIQEGDVLSDAEALDFADNVELALQRFMLRDNPHLSDAARQLYAVDDSSVKATVVESSDPSEIGRTGKVDFKLASEVGKSAAQVDAERIARDLAEGAGWKGTPPAEGTRRALIFGVIDRFAHRLISGHGGKQTAKATFDLADEIESALLEATIAAEGVEVKHWIDEDLREPREALAAVGKALDRLDAPQGATYAERIDRLYRELARPSLVPSPIHDLLDAVAVPREAYDSGDAGPQRIFTLSERVEKLIRSYQNQQATLDGLADLRTAQVERLAGPHPDRDDTAADEDDPAATIKFLEGEVERLLGGREEARAGESRYAEERDCAFALLRWLLPVTVAKRID